MEKAEKSKETSLSLADFEHASQYARGTLSALSLADFERAQYLTLYVHCSPLSLADFEHKLDAVLVPSGFLLVLLILNVCMYGLLLILLSRTTRTTSLSLADFELVLLSTLGGGASFS